MLQRIVALILKELSGLWQDPKTRMVILVPPLVQVLLFAYAATYDVTNVPLGVWNDDSGAQSAELVRRFAGSPAFHLTRLLQSPAQAQDALDSKDVAVVLHIPQDFSANLLGKRRTPVQLLVDARRSNTALMAQGYAGDIAATYAQELAPGHTPLVVVTHDWFNPTL